MADDDARTVDVDRDAPVVVSDEILVHAPVEVVWDLQTDVSDWPAWRTGIESAELVGRFEVGATFHWATGGLEIASTIEQARRHRRAAWGGPASGIMGMHVWEFTPEAGGTRVATVESWAGAPVEADVKQARTMLAEHLAQWLRDLKRAAESATEAAAD